MRCLPAIALFACAHAQEPNTERGVAAIPVQTSPVRIEPLSPTLHGAGRLRATDEVTLSFPSGGVIARLTVDSGERVHRGQILAVLDAAASRARLDSARSAEEKAERDFARASALEGSSLARQHREDANTGLELARAAMTAAQFEVRRSVLVAPGDGVVLSRHAEPEQTVSPGAPVLRLATDDAWELEISLPSAQALRVSAGEPATVALLAYPGRLFEGRVARRAGGASALGLWTLWIALEPVDPAAFPLASGLIGSADLAPDTEPVPVVPLAALTEVDGSNAAVYTVRDGHAHKIPVELLWMVGDQVAIRPGTDEENLEVITVGTMLVRDGAAVVQ